MWGSGMSDDGDYHRTLNGNAYENWLKKVCEVVARKAGSRKPVLVIDNAPYHCELVEKVEFGNLKHLKSKVQIPTKSSTKSDIASFLTSRRVSCDTSQKKPDLVALLDSYVRSQGGRSKLRKYKVDLLASQYGVTVVRLPPYHCTLNPIEYYWGWLKAKLSKAATSGDKLTDFRRNAMKFISEMTDVMQRAFFNRSLTVEMEFILKDRLVFIDVKPFVIPLDGNDSDNNSIFGSDEDNDDESLFEQWGLELEDDSDVVGLEGVVVDEEEKRRLSELFKGSKYT